jgi:hypothetical protein
MESQPQIEDTQTLETNPNSSESSSESAFSLVDNSDQPLQVSGENTRFGLTNHGSDSEVLQLQHAIVAPPNISFAKMNLLTACKELETMVSNTSDLPLLQRATKDVKATIALLKSRRKSSDALIPDLPKAKKYASNVNHIKQIRFFRTRKKKSPNYSRWVNQHHYKLHLVRTILRAKLNFLIVRCVSRKSQIT